MIILENNFNQNMDILVPLAKEVYSDDLNLAGLCLSQAVLESGLADNKPSQLAQKYNNLFGIKAGGLTKSGTDGVINLDTTEYVNGKLIKVKQQFLANLEPKDSFIQHRRLMKLVRYYDVWHKKSIFEAASGLVKGGYATDPGYRGKLQATYDLYVRKYFK